MMSKLVEMLVKLPIRMLNEFHLNERIKQMKMIYKLISDNHVLKSPFFFFHGENSGVGHFKTG